MKEKKTFKQYVKEHKVQFLIASGATLLIGVYFLGKKVVARDRLSDELLQVFNEGVKATTEEIPEGVSKIYKQIDEDIFVDVASAMEDALIDLGVETLDLNRSWEVADGITKTLDVSIKTIKK